MSNWKHKHIIDLSSFSFDDYEEVLQLAHRFKRIPQAGSRKLPALQGRLITTLFFEPSTRTRSSFELAAKRLSADLQSFSPSTSSLTKGETPLDTALTYVAMGADVLVVRHNSTNVPQHLASSLEKAGKKLDMKIAAEIFADRNYEDDGNLVSRSKKNAMITDPEIAKNHVIKMVQNQALNCYSGKQISCDIDSVCVHGDGKSAVNTAKLIREGLIKSGVTLNPFDKMKKFI